MIDNVVKTFYRRVTIFAFLLSCTLTAPPLATAAPIIPYGNAIDFCLSILRKSSDLLGQLKAAKAEEIEISDLAEADVLTDPVVVTDPAAVVELRPLENKLSLEDFFAEIITEVATGRDGIDLTEPAEWHEANFILEKANSRYTGHDKFSKAHKDYLRKKLAHHFRDLQKGQRRVRDQIERAKKVKRASTVEKPTANNAVSDLSATAQVMDTAHAAQVAETTHNNIIQLPTVQPELPSANGLTFKYLLLKIQDGSPIAFDHNLIDLIEDFSLPVKIPEADRDLTIRQALEIIVEERKLKAIELSQQVKSMGQAAHYVKTAVSRILTRYAQETAEAILSHREYKYIDGEAIFDPSHQSQARVLHMTAIRPRADGAELAVIAATAHVTRVSTELMDMPIKGEYNFKHLPKGREKHDRMAEVILKHLKNATDLSRYGLSKSSDFKNWAKRAADGEIDVVYEIGDKTIWAEVKSAPVTKGEHLEPILVQAWRRMMFKDAFQIEAEDHIYFVKGISEALAKKLRKLGYVVHGVKTPASAM